MIGCIRLIEHFNTIYSCKKEAWHPILCFIMHLSMKNNVMKSTLNFVWCIVRSKIKRINNYDLDASVIIILHMMFRYCVRSLESVVLHLLAHIKIHNMDTFLSQGKHRQFKCRRIENGHVKLLIAGHHSILPNHESTWSHISQCMHTISFFFFPWLLRCIKIA